MIGQKGIPGHSGGVERHVEEISTRLAAAGLEVTVYCRRHYTPETGPHRGIRRIHLPSLPTKHLDAGTHTLVSVLDSLFRGYDIVHFHGIGPSFFAPLARVSGTRVVMTYHAQDWRQAKWGPAARGFLRRGESHGIRASHRVITVSEILRTYVRERYGVEAVRIPNGANPSRPPPPRLIRSTYGLEGRDYVLSVGRMIPERGFAELIRAFQKLGTPGRLVLVGAAPFGDPYEESLRALAGDDVILTGALSGPVLDELYANALLYVNPSVLEGLPISVLEAMAFGTPVLVSDIPENLEAVGEAAFRYRAGDPDDLERALAELLGGGERLPAMGARGRRRVEERFSWESISERVMGVYRDLLEERAA
jgi:glycosyltransferase involved in cell wall biosynthesis